MIFKLILGLLFFINTELYCAEVNKAKLYCAEVNKAKREFNYLINYIKEIDRNVECTQKGAIELIDKYLSKKYDINEKYGYQHNLLYFAASLGFESIVAFLIQKRADVNIVDRFGRPILSQCLEYPNILQMLIKAGANSQALINNQTVIEYCAEQIKIFQNVIQDKECSDSIKQFYATKIQIYLISQTILGGS